MCALLAASVPGIMRLRSQDFGAIHCLCCNYVSNPTPHSNVGVGPFVVAVTVSNPGLPLQMSRPTRLVTDAMPVSIT